MASRTVGETVAPYNEDEVYDVGSIPEPADPRSFISRVEQEARTSDTHVYRVELKQKLCEGGIQDLSRLKLDPEIPQLLDPRYGDRMVSVAEEREGNDMRS